jgi:hypothetical protein
MREELRKTINELLFKARTKATKRLFSFSNPEWYNIIKEALVELKKQSNLLSVYILIDEVQGLMLDVICKKDTYTDATDFVVSLQLSLFDKYTKLWGYIRAHDERGEMHSYYSRHYRVSLI